MRTIECRAVSSSANQVPYPKEKGGGLLVYEEGTSFPKHVRLVNRFSDLA